MIHKKFNKISSNWAICLLLIFFSCNKEKQIDSKYEDFVYSMVYSWNLTAAFNISLLDVHDFSHAGKLNTFIEDDALFFLFPGETCNSCLDREFNKYLNWETSIEKYILAFNTNTNYLQELKRNHTQIKKVFVVQNELKSFDMVEFPYIVFYRKTTNTYLCYAAVKSDINHFDYFKTLIESLHEDQMF